MDLVVLCYQVLKCNIVWHHNGPSSISAIKIGVILFGIIMDLVVLVLSRLVQYCLAS